MTILSQGTSSETSQQFKCDICGQVFNSQKDLDEHYKSIHTSQVASQIQATRGMSSTSGSSAARWSGQATEHQEEAETRKDTSTIEGEGSSRTWKEATEEVMKSMEKPQVETTGTEGVSDREMASAYREQGGRGEETALHGEGNMSKETAVQDQYKCQHCGQVFANQTDLDKHMKNIHGIDTESDIGKRGQPQESMAR